MSIRSITARHLVRHYRETIISGPAGGRTASVVELGTKKCTVNPDSDFESPEMGTRNESITASIYFSYDPDVRTNDFLEITHTYVRGAYLPSTSETYRVESHIDFQNQNRIWRVRATKREAL